MDPGICGMRRHFSSTGALNQTEEELGAINMVGAARFKQGTKAFTGIDRCSRHVVFLKNMFYMSNVVNISNEGLRDRRLTQQISN